MQKHSKYDLCTTPPYLLACTIRVCLRRRIGAVSQIMLLLALLGQLLLLGLVSATDRPIIGLLKI